MVIKLKTNNIICQDELKISAICIFSISHNKIVFNFVNINQKLSTVSGGHYKEQNYQHISTKV